MGVFSNNGLSSFLGGINSNLNNSANNLANEINALDQPAPVTNSSSTDSLNNTVGNALSNPLSTAATAAGLPSTATITDLFLRGIVVITGFIFVAVALTMFSKKQNIISVTLPSRKKPETVKTDDE